MPQYQTLFTHVSRYNRSYRPAIALESIFSEAFKLVGLDVRTQKAVGNNKGLHRLRELFRLTFQIKEHSIAEASSGY